MKMKHYFGPPFRG